MHVLDSSNESTVSCWLRRPRNVFIKRWVRHYGLLLDGWVGPYGQGTVWSISDFSTGRLQPVQRHVRSRHRMNSANPADGRYPGSRCPDGTVSGLRVKVAANSRTDSAGRIPNPHR